jgi:hypothetical protein
MSATISITESQLDFHREFLLARQTWEPKQFDIDMHREELINLFVEELSSTSRGMWTIDELCLHPREALQFCDDLRRKRGFMLAALELRA